MRPSKEVRGLPGQIVISVEVFQGDEEAIRVKGIKESVQTGDRAGRSALPAGGELARALTSLLGVCSGFSEMENRQQVLSREPAR